MTHGRRPAGQQVQVAERVTFMEGSCATSGYVARKGRTYAHVVTDDGTEVRVPYRLLSRVLGTAEDARAEPHGHLACPVPYRRQGTLRGRHRDAARDH